MFLNGEPQLNIEVTNGIRQGCNGSTMLFTLITYQIIETLQTQIRGFRNGKFNIPAIFYADDGLLLAHTYKDAKESIRKLTDIAKLFGLEINENKSNILIYN